MSKQYGHFDDAAREYVITDPATPWPWINYLGSEDFFSLISNTAGGYCFCRDAKFRRILRYRYNGVPMDDGGRYFYIREADGTVWNPGWKPCKTPLDRYECRHGMGYTRISGEHAGLRAELLFFVPPGHRCEIHQFTLTNGTSAARDIRLYSFVEWCLWNAATDMENFQRNLSTGEVEIDGSTLYHKTEYRERRDHYAFYGVNAPIDGFDTDRESFLGPYNGFNAPQCVLEGRSGHSVAHGWSPAASHCLCLHLEPGERRTLVFTLGYVENPREAKFAPDGSINKAPARALLAAFDTEEKVERAFAKLQACWDSLLGRFQLSSGCPELDRMVNIWNPYQCMVTFNMSRSASFFESGIGRGMGFRDSNQDLVGFVHQIPERARQRILDIAATQFPDGGCYHQYQPLTKRGNDGIGGGFGDDPLWLIFGTVAYLKETGDFSILDEPVPFDNAPGTEVTLLEHLRTSFFHVAEQLGPHGLPLIGRADWNDCLNLNCFSDTPDESFQTFSNPNAPDDRVAESVLIAGMFVAIGPELVALEKRRGNEDAAAKAQAEIDKMTRAIETDGWDGEWFVRAYDALGHKVGSHECEDGKIFIESQGYCVMGGVGVANGKAEQALESVHRYLETEHGIVLLQPAYKDYHLELGEVSSYPCGYKENAGIFCHNNPWIIAAETVVGHGDRAFDLYSRIAPAWREEISDLHKMEPYVYSQMIAGKDAPNFGQAKNSWLTGTAAWNFYVISNYILGIKPDWDGLKVDPCIPHTWDGYSVSRRFRGAIYDIRIDNAAHVCRGVKAVTVDGQAIEGNVLPVFADGKKHEVVVTLG